MLSTFSKALYVEKYINFKHGLQIDFIDLVIDFRFETVTKFLKYHIDCKFVVADTICYNISISKVKM